jgi:hypothetical protein
MIRIGCLKAVFTQIHPNFVIVWAVGPAPPHAERWLAQEAGIQIRGTKRSAIYLLQSQSNLCPIFLLIYFPLCRGYVWQRSGREEVD